MLCAHGRLFEWQLIVTRTKSATTILPRILRARYPPPPPPPQNLFLRNKRSMFKFFSIFSPLGIVLHFISLFNLIILPPLHFPKHEQADSRNKGESLAKAKFSGLFCSSAENNIRLDPLKDSTMLAVTIMWNDCNSQCKGRYDIANLLLKFGSVIRNFNKS